MREALAAGPRGARLMVAAALAVAASGCLLSPPMRFGGGKSPYQAQRHILDEQLPAQLVPTGRWQGEVRTARLRVWADAEYRAQNIQWQHAFEDQLDAANQVLTPMLGVRLEAEYRAWDRHAPGVTLTDHIEALVRQDPGEDVVWVVGLVSALSLVSPTFEQLGLAGLRARHVIVRGHADLEERRELARVLPDLDAKDLDQALEARRRHKQAAVLLHELAHSLGAPHELGATSIMNANYSHRATAFGERTRELMLIELEERLAPPAKRDPRATASRMLAALEVEWGGWDAEERTDLIAQLRAELVGPAPNPGAGGAGAGGAPAAGITGPVPAAIATDFAHVQQLLATGDHVGAAAALEPLVAAYPAHVELRMLGCRIELARGGVKDPRAIAACERAIQLSAGAEPAIDFARARIAAGDVAGGRATLAAAEARLAGLPADQAAASWRALAEQYRAMEAVTWTEDALARAGAGAEHPLARWAAMTRVRYGIPRQGARYRLTAADDAAALAAVRELRDLVYAGKGPAAERAAAAAERRWPGLPGLLAMRCDLELRRGAQAAAAQLCGRAASGGSSWATYLAGVIALRDTSPRGTAAGIERLRAAIALDPELGQAWRALAKALDRARDRAALEQLGRDYQARFGQPLP